MQLEDCHSLTPGEIYIFTSGGTLAWGLQEHLRVREATGKQGG